MRRRRTVSRRASPWALGHPWERLRGAIGPRLSIPFRQGTLHLITLALILLTLSLLVSFVNQVIQSARLETQRVALATEVARIEQENTQYLGAVEFAESDVSVERIAREQLGMAREGDVVILPQMQVPTPVPAAAAAKASLTVPETPNWELWWTALFPAPAP